MALRREARTNRKNVRSLSKSVLTPPVARFWATHSITILNELSIAGQSMGLTLVKFKEARVTASRQTQISSRGSNCCPPRVRAQRGRARGNEPGGDRAARALALLLAAFSLTGRRGRG